MSGAEKAEVLPDADPQGAYRRLCCGASKAGTAAGTVQAGEVAHARIYDRILERCAPVLFSGKNFREEGARATKAAAKEIVRKE